MIMTSTKILNILLSFPDYATPLTLKNSLRITLGSKPEKLNNIKARKQVGFFYKKVYFV